MDPSSCTAPAAAVPRLAATRRPACVALRGIFPRQGRRKMGQGGLEPPTPRLSSVCSNQLSYWPPAPAQWPGPDHGMGEGCADGAGSRGAGHAARDHPDSQQGWQGARWMGLVCQGQRRLHPEMPGPGLARGRSVVMLDRCSQGLASLPRTRSLKGGDPAAGSPTATLLRLHPSH